MERTLPDSDLIKLIASKTGMTEAKARSAVEATVSSLSEAVKRGERIELRGFGTLVITPRSEKPEEESQDEEKFREEKQKAEDQAGQKSIRELIDSIGRKEKKPKKVEVLAPRFDTDPNVTVYAKKRAAGNCRLCNQPAPFMDRRGNPFLEVHHIVWLAKDGEDTTKNTVALCPNCHRKMHILDREDDRAVLMEKAKVDLPSA